MATTTVTPTSAAPERPKLVSKPSESSVPVTPTQTSFGCQHIKGLLQAARDKAIDGYTRLINAVRNEDNVSGQVYKAGETVKSTHGATYLCLQCPNVTKGRERHRKDHVFSVESTNGFIFCHECRDFVYDPTFESIRSSNGKKRKASAPQSAEGDKRLLANNTTTTPCAATGLRGLYNMGQTCFMSVILQSLVHNPFIRTYYLSECHKRWDCAREACTSCALDDIFTDFFGFEKHEGYGAVQMLQGCWKGGGGLAGYSQQDAHEYLGFILNSLHAANTAEDEEPENGAKRKTDRDCDCAVHQTFGGLFKSTVTCTKCKNTTSTLDPFMDLSLDIRNSHNIITKKKKLALTNGTQTTKEVAPMDLSECLDRFTAPETLAADSYNCRKCGGAQEARKKLSLARLPPVVPIHLKRFRHDKGSGGGSSSKVETKIRFPLSLDLTPYAAKTKASAPTTNGTTSDSAEKDKDADKDTPAAEPPVDPIYELSSVVVHKGKLDNGHYISYARQGDEWFRFDDSMVVQVDAREVLGAEAYMLFYVLAEI